MSLDAANWNDFVQHVALSDIGMRRGNNQDSWKVAMAGDMASWRQRGHLFVVADGMGAHAAGELASKIAVDNIPLAYDKLRHMPVHAAIHEAIVMANTLIYTRGQSNTEFLGMGTTCSALVLLPNSAIVAHVGDSRVYRLRGETLSQLTFDHSLVWEMMEAGRYDEDHVPGFIPKNVITRSLGPQPTVHVDVEGPFAIEPGDIFLLCTDGLTGQIPDEQIAALLTYLSPQDAAQTLIDLANLRGGPDNITAVIAKAESVPSKETMGFAPIAMGVSGIGALGAALLGMWPMTAVCSVVLAGLLIWRLAGANSASQRLPSQSVGRAPYRIANCRVTTEFLAELDGFARQLFDIADEEQWEFPRDDLSKRLSEARRAADSDDFRQAIVHYSDIVRRIMRQVRTMQRQKASDSSVDM